MSFFEVRDLVKNFGGLLAVNGVSFSVKKGEIFGLIGPNGSGKTTIFNLITGFYPLTKGEIYFEGKRIDRLKTHKICKLGIGRTFQVVKPLARLTVLDNVMASAFNRSTTIKDAREKALEALEFCGLDHRKDVLARSLPIGERKRLEITRSYATGPKLLLLDETAAGLNPTELDKAIELILKIRDHGVTIVIVEHIMRVIMSISERILAINYGMPIGMGTPQEVADNEEVIKAYLGEEVDYA